MYFLGGGEEKQGSFHLRRRKRSVTLLVGVFLVVLMATFLKLLSEVQNIRTNTGREISRQDSAGKARKDTG